MSERTCHDGNRTWFLKFLHEDAGIRRGFAGRGFRIDVEEGSKPADAGVRRAFKF
jgi:hypothetical protein